ncbi:MAG TPA: alpha/beta fold hydrolase [Thermoanaerobaculia bacterium]|jgi:pimeloyl-ACP methyl ester carboxylesterase|nr:alpha/beta fold hydrolase [Thermoanaerobaculia bacterium]
MLNVTDLGEGVPILWIHGFPFASSIYENQLPIRNARHVMPDLPGFGQSRPDGGEMTMDAYARLMVGLLDQRGIDRAVFAGLSMGGYICFAMARIAPERMRGLILLDTRETADTEEGRKGRYEMIEKVKQTGVKPIVDAMLPKMLTPRAPRDMRDRVREIMSSASPEGVIVALHAMATRPDSTPTLKEIRVPTLVVVGEEDPITPPADSERMAGAIADARLVRVAGAAHAANYEKAVDVNRAVAGFLSGV